MNAMDKESLKRKRDTEVKKWTEDEVNKTLSYMQLHRNIEKPTAQVYYKKLLQNTEINASWNIVRGKVRHLKASLKKADDWTNSTGAGVEKGDGASTVKDKVLKICPHYDQLSDIFSGAKEIEVEPIDTFSDFIEYSPYDATDTDQDDSFLAIDEPGSSTDVSFAQKVKRRRQNTCIDKLEVLETQRTEFREKQLSLESETLDWAKEAENKKLEMEQQKIDNDKETGKKKLEMKQQKLAIEQLKLEMEQQKINNDFQIKKLELEQNERIKMFEIEAKYKNNK